MSLNVKTYMKSICLVSKIFILSPFSHYIDYNLESSPWISWNVFHTVSFFSIYFTFHLSQSFEEMTDKTHNMVTEVINTYNRYSGLLLYCVLVLSALFHRNKNIKIMSLFNEVEILFATKLNVKIRNLNVMR